MRFNNAYNIIILNRSFYTYFKRDLVKYIYNEFHLQCSWVPILVIYSIFGKTT